MITIFSNIGSGQDILSTNYLVIKIWTLKNCYIYSNNRNGCSKYLEVSGHRLMECKSWEMIDGDQLIQFPAQYWIPLLHCFLSCGEKK